MKNVAIFASGSGTNAENIVRYFSKSETIKVAVVLSNNRNVGVHARVNKLGVPSFVFSREEFADGAPVLAKLAEYDTDLIVLAGFMNKISVTELDDVGLLVRRSGAFSKPNHLYVKIPSDEIGLQTVDNKAVEKMAVIESEKHPSSGRKNGCAGVRNVAPSKVTEKNKRNKYHEVNYCYGEGESL